MLNLIKNKNKWGEVTKNLKHRILLKIKQFKIIWFDSNYFHTYLKTTTFIFFLLSSSTVFSKFYNTVKVSPSISAAVPYSCTLLSAISNIVCENSTVQIKIINNKTPIIIKNIWVIYWRMLWAFDLRKLLFFILLQCTYAHNRYTKCTVWDCLSCFHKKSVVYSFEIVI